MEIEDLVERTPMIRQKGLGVSVGVSHYFVE